MNILNKIFENKCNLVISVESMYPILKNGEKINIDCKMKKICFGDVVLFYDKKVYVHRVIFRVGKLYLLKGDNNKNVDGFYKMENIVGKVRMKKCRRIATLSLCEAFLFSVFDRWLNVGGMHDKLINVYKTYL